MMAICFCCCAVCVAFICAWFAMPIGFGPHVPGELCGYHCAKTGAAMIKSASVRIFLIFLLSYAGLSLFSIDPHSHLLVSSWGRLLPKRKPFVKYKMHFAAKKL